MPTLTILKKRAKKDVVVISRKEYESLLQTKRMQEFVPTVAEKRALLRAEKNLQRGKTLSYNELVKKLGFAN